MAIARVFLTNLGMYNEGVLNGEWLELPTSDEEIKAAFDRCKISHDRVHYCSQYGAKCGEYEEYFLTDWESEIDLEIGEYSNINELNRICEEIEDSGEFEKIKAIFEAGFYRDIDEILNKIDDIIFYEGDADEILDNLIDEELACLTHGAKIPDLLTRYFDYEAYKRDLLFDYTATSNGLLLNH